MSVIQAVPDIQGGYSSASACVLAGVTYRQLDYWDKRGVIKPEVPARGSGSSRRYSAAQVEELALAVALRDLGVSLDRIEDILNEARVYAGADALVITAEDIRAARSDEIAYVLAETGGIGVVIVARRQTEGTTE